MKTAIITIGDEILIGQIVDTNSAWMAQKMTSVGFEISEKIAIGDDADQIKNTISDVFNRVDVILLTGGLGPTKDDITKKTLCEYYNTELVFDESVHNNIKNVISNAFTLNTLTQTQAYVPKTCTVIQNRVGTAPIMWFERNGKVLVSMPGVPYEMRYAMENEIVARLLDQFKPEAYLHKVYLVRGYSESALAIHLTNFENNLPQSFGLAYLPSFRLMKLRLFVKNEDRESELSEQARKLEDLLHGSIIADKEISLEKLLGERLFEKDLTLSTAESCTGGNIAHLVTSVAGSSRYFKGSVVSYSNETKINVLHILPESLAEFGAVSEAVVIEMARGAQRVLETDCSIAVSGIAGPDGGTEDKPVGTVWICTTYKDTYLAKKYQLGKYREANINGASSLGMIQLLEMLAD